MTRRSLAPVALALVLACTQSRGNDAADGSAGTTGNASTVADTGSTSAGTSATTTADTVTGESDGSGSSSNATTTTSSASTGTGDESSNESGSSDTGDDANVLYVRDDGLDGNPGTRDEPMRTIQWAITQAGVLGGIDTIRVAEGDYEVEFANEAHIVMVEGVSLYGGWRADWDDHDPDAYASNIVDVSVTAVPTTESDPHRAVEIPAGLTSATVLDGFRIGIDRGQFRASVFASGDATVSNNVIAPGTDNDPVWIYGARVQMASPTLVGDRIVINGVGAAGIGSAIHAMDSDGLFANNVITLVDTTSTLYGIYLSQGEAQVLANSVHADATTNVWRLLLNRELITAS